MKPIFQTYPLIYQIDKSGRLWFDIIITHLFSYGTMIISNAMLSRDIPIAKNWKLNKKKLYSDVNDK